MRAECRPEFTPSTNGELADSASTSGRKLRSASCTRDRAVGAGDPDVHVETERVVAPDDVAEELVVPPVVRRVDDPLVLPAAPRVRAGRAERELLFARERVDLRAALLHLRGRFLEAGAAAGADLDLGCDQLADDVLGEVGAIGGRLQRLEPVRELERLGVEERELLFDRDA